MNYLLNNNFQVICQYILKNFYNCNWWAKYDQLQQVECFSRIFVFLQTKTPDDIFNSNLTMQHCLGDGKIDTWWIGALVFFFSPQFNFLKFPREVRLSCMLLLSWVNTSWANTSWHARWVMTKMSILSFDHFVIPRRILCNRNKMQNRIWFNKINHTTYWQCLEV